MASNSPGKRLDWVLLLDQKCPKSRAGFPAGFPRITTMLLSGSSAAIIFLPRDRSAGILSNSPGEKRNIMRFRSLITALCLFATFAAGQGPGRREKVLIRAPKPYTGLVQA